MAQKKQIENPSGGVYKANDPLTKTRKATTTTQGTHFISSIFNIAASSLSSMVHKWIPKSPKTDSLKNPDPKGLQKCKSQILNTKPATTTDLSEAMQRTRHFHYKQETKYEVSNVTNTTHRHNKPQLHKQPERLLINLVQDIVLLT